MTRIALGAVDEVRRARRRRSSGARRRARARRRRARAASSVAQVVGLERLEPEQRRPREQRTREREERVLGGRADEHEQSFLDVREERVLLRAVEPMDLVEEEDRAAARARPFARAARSATSRTSLTPAVTADNGSNAFSVAPATRRAMVVLPVPGGPQRITDDSRSRLDQYAQRLAKAQQVLLADHVVEGTGPQARRERCAATAAARRPRQRRGRPARDIWYDRARAHSSWARGCSNAVPSDRPCTVIVEKEPPPARTCAPPRPHADGSPVRRTGPLGPDRRLSAPPEP